MPTLRTFQGWTIQNGFELQGVIWTWVYAVRLTRRIVVEQISSKTFISPTNVQGSCACKQLVGSYDEKDRMLVIDPFQICIRIPGRTYLCTKLPLTLLR